MKTLGEGCALMCEDVPWGNSECLGAFASLKEADAAAERQTGSIGLGIAHERIESLGATLDESEDGCDGFRYDALPLTEGPALWVRLTPCEGGEERLFGPYEGVAEANAALFPRNARKKFAMAPGTFGWGCYPVERREGEYKALFADGRGASW